MKPKQSMGVCPLPPPVEAPLQLNNGREAIAVEFTDERLSAHAGSAGFWSWLRGTGVIAELERLLPHPQPVSNNHLTPLTKALGFIHGLLCGAEKLTQMAYLRHDPVAPELLGVPRLPSQSSLSRFLQGFEGAGANLRCFRPLWQWAMRQLPSRREGYSLDLDSTRLLHEDGRQEGVRAGYTRVGVKPCLHPLLAVLEEAKLVVQFWLRPGNCACANNAVSFVLDLLGNLPAHIRLRVVRADSGFCWEELLALWERQGLPYIVSARLTTRIQSLIRRDTVWMPTPVTGTEVAEVLHQEPGWRCPRRLILVRHRVAEKGRAGGRKLIDVPGYLFQALVTSLPDRVVPLDVWRDYNQRAGCESVIKELDQHYALPKLIVRSFWGTEAALCLAVLSYNLVVLFQRKLGWLDKVSLGSLRFRLFITAGKLVQPQGRKTLRLAVPPGERDWWRRVWEKLHCPFPNCHAVENQPAYA